MESFLERLGSAARPRLGQAPPVATRAGHGRREGPRRPPPEISFGLGDRQGVGEDIVVSGVPDGARRDLGLLSASART